MRPMDRPKSTSALLERILAAPGGTVVVTGPAAGGKTTAALDLYRSAANADGRSRAMMIVPNAPTAAYVRRRLLDESAAGVVVAPQVLTFTALARRIVGDSPDQPAATTLTAFRRQLLLRRIIDDLDAKGGLDGFRAVVDTRGLVIAVDAAIAELKRAAVEPDELAAVIGNDPATRALQAVYRRYQHQLQAANAYDVEGRMWLARDRLADWAGRDRRPPALADLAVVAVDGFTDFTPTQLEILRLLSGWADHLLVTLPHLEGGPERLWHWTGRTLERLRSAFGEKVSVIPIDLPPRSGIAGLWDRVFEHEPDDLDLPADISLIVAAGVEQEVAAAAANIKRLLIGGRAGSIAVLTRSPVAYRPAIQRIFADADIPIAETPVAITETPPVRFLLAAATIAPQLDSEAVLAVIGNSYFRPGALGDFDERTVATAQALIREGNVLSSAKAYADAAERFARRARQSVPDDNDDAESLQPSALLASADGIEQAAEMLRRLFDLPGNNLPALAEALELPRAIRQQGDARGIARDLRALAAMESALGQLPDPAPLRHIRDALAVVQCPPARTESLVDVLDALDARAVRYDHVFLLGLSEGQFPRRFVDSPLLSDSDRQAFSSRGIQIDLRDDLTAREMLLFYLAVSRCDGALTLGTLESDAAGKPSAASPFLPALTRPIGGLGDVPTETAPLGRIIPPPEAIVSPREAANRAWCDLFDAAAPTPNRALAWAARQAPATVGRTAMGLWARSRRMRAGPCDSFDGRISDSDLLAGLRRHYPGEAIFSASQLEQYAGCPWRYFAAHVLGLAEPTTPQQSLRAVARGQLCHDMLFEAMTALAAAHGRPLHLPNIAENDLAAAIDAAVAAVAGRAERLSPPPYPALWRVEIDQLTRRVRRYLLDQRNISAWPAACLHFELAFGMSGRRRSDNDLADDASTDEPIRIDTSAGPIRLRGRIDRVDQIHSDDHAGLLVIDYKTGAPPTRKSIGQGVHVQIPLYAEAARQLLDQEPLGGAYHRIADVGKIVPFAALKVYRGALRPDAAYADDHRAAMAAVGAHVEGMAGGCFDVLPRHDCPTWCSFRQICQFARWRAELKTADRGEDGP